MQAVGETTAGHHAAGEFVNQHHFAVFDDILGILMEQRVGAQGLADVMHQRNVMDVVQVAIGFQ